MLPLEGIRVLDFTRHLPGPYATDILRRLGAQVLKVEPPDGDPTRWLPPIVGDTGSLFHLVNSGKESVVVDLKAEIGRDFARKLASGPFWFTAPRPMMTLPSSGRSRIRASSGGLCHSEGSNCLTSYMK